MNRVVDQLADETDPFVASAGRRVPKETQW